MEGRADMVGSVNTITDWAPISRKSSPTSDVPPGPKLMLLVANSQIESVSCCCWWEEELIVIIDAHLLKDECAAAAAAGAEAQEGRKIRKQLIVMVDDLVAHVMARHGSVFENKIDLKSI